MTTTFPVADVLVGSYKTVGFDETRHWADILLGMVAHELVIRAEKVKAVDDYRRSPEYTAWLEDADNFIDFLLANYNMGRILDMTRYLVAEQRLPFNVQRQRSFDALSAKMVEFIAG